jgi:hypothetical protein
MMQKEKLTTNLLLITQAVGAVFAAVFLAAYLGGMFMTPSTTVLHALPAFRIPLIISGAALLILVLACLCFSWTITRKTGNK